MADIGSATPWGALINGIAGVAKVAAAPMQAPPQRADGYSLGGMLEATSPNMFSSGSTGGAFGGAWSQTNVDGSNWTVSTGRSAATASGNKSGGNGGVSPTTTNGMGGGLPETPFNMLATTNKNGMVLLIGLAAVAYFILRK